MTAQEEIKKNQEYLPKENLDFPKEPMDLPKEPLDLPLSSSQPVSQNQSEPASQSTDNPHSYEIKTLLSWSAPGRPFRKRGKQYYLTSLLIMLLVEVILFLFL